jgi:hypothetical protein
VTLGLKSPQGVHDIITSSNRSPRFLSADHYRCTQLRYSFKVSLYEMPTNATECNLEKTASGRGLNFKSRYTRCPENPRRTVLRVVVIFGKLTVDQWVHHDEWNLNALVMPVPYYHYGIIIIIILLFVQRLLATKMIYLCKMCNNQ